MGAWSHESFGNDDACDWIADLREGTDLGPIDVVLDEVLAVGGDYLEAPLASQAIAAAEVVARLQGHAGVRDAYSEALDEWVAGIKLLPSPQLASKARRALERILAAPSELLELWEESGEPGEWRAAVEDLESRITT
jgi:hypothetical protein